MKFAVEDDFVADYHRLTNEERALFRQVIRQINEAYAGRGNRPLLHWPVPLRVKRMSDTPGIWELTWSFSAGWSCHVCVAHCGRRSHPQVAADR